MSDDCETAWERVLKHGGDIVAKRYRPGGKIEVEKIDTYAPGGKLVSTRVMSSPIYGGPVTITYDDAGHVASITRDDAS
jgi:hypothetical protein